MEELLIKARVIQYNGAKNLLAVGSVMFFLIGIILFLGGFPLGGAILTIAAVLLVVCLLLVQKGVRAGMVIAIVICSLVAVYSCFLLIVFEGLEIMAMMFIAVAFAVFSLQAAIAAKRIPKEVDIIGTWKKSRDDIKEKKKNGTYDKKQERENRKNGIIEMDIIYFE